MSLAESFKLEDPKIRQAQAKSSALVDQHYVLIAQNIQAHLFLLPMAKDLPGKKKELSPNKGVLFEQLQELIISKVFKEILLLAMDIRL